MPERSFQRVTAHAKPIDLENGDYSFCIVRIAWTVEKHSTGFRRKLLFGLVELLPTEIPPPIDDGEQELRLAKLANLRVYIRHVVTSARRGVAWYRDCANGMAVRPDDAGVLGDPADPSTIRIESGALHEEPIWPELLLAYHPSQIPFLASWHDCPRVHHLIAQSEPDLAWSTDQRREAESWLAERLPFSFHDYPELLGSVHLLAPNPVFRSVDCQVRDAAPGTEELEYRFHRRAGRALAGLTLILGERRPSGIALVEIVPIRRDHLIVALSHRVDMPAELLVDEVRGPLWFRPPAGFIKAVNFTVDLVTSSRIFTDKAGARREVPISGHSMPSSVGTAVDNVALARIGTAWSRRQQIALSEQIGLKWFFGRDRKAEGAATIVKMMKTTRTSLLIVDPYFRRGDLAVALEVFRTSVTVRILTSAEVLRQQSSQGIGGSSEAGEGLLEAVTVLAATQGANPLEVRVMQGERPEVHDRFLALDDQLWLLGSSLAEFGMRGTMMVRLPHPDLVRSDLEGVWAAAVPLAAWVDERRRRRPVRPPGGDGTGVAEQPNWRSRVHRTLLGLAALVNPRPRDNR